MSKQPNTVHGITQGQPDFRESAPQYVEWGNEVHTVTYAGQCGVCGTRIYDGMESAWLDHNNQSLEAADYGKVGPDFPLCFNCSNTEPNYRRALQLANGRSGKWKWVEAQTEGEPA